MTRLRWLILSTVAAVLLLAVACGGGSKSATNGGSGASSSQSLDLASTAQNLLAAQSFRFSGDLKISVDSTSGSSGAVSPLLGMLGDVKVQGAFVAPGDVDVTLTALDQTVHYVQIGSDAWLNTGDGWHSGEAVDISGIADSTAGTPSGATLPGVLLNGARTKSESVNGVHTTHYAFDKTALTNLAANVAGQSGGSFDDIAAANLDLWISDDGLPIKMVTHLAGDSKVSKTTIDSSFQITDLNAKVTIDRPVP
ncbi:MAG TPA: hypothetical protein VFY10_10530 [Dehalococcoidia bacterium]|nr:hypothetical protein [Dehalococcoidia bacterium]